MSISTISAADVFARRGNGPGVLIDVRTPAEYEEVHAEGATLFPLEQFSLESFRQIPGTDAGPVYVLCQTETRAKTAAEKLLAAGQNEVIVVQGGTRAWEAAGLPVVRGRKTISLERQVRITAGSLVVLGVLLGWFVNRWFFGLSGFVGAGLVFAGITDTCGMAMVLARAPWNQAGAAKPSEEQPACAGS